MLGDTNKTATPRGTVQISITKNPKNGCITKGFGLSAKFDASGIQLLKEALYPIQSFYNKNKQQGDSISLEEAKKELASLYKIYQNELMGPGTYKQRNTYISNVSSRDFPKEVKKWHNDLLRAVILSEDRYVVKKHPDFPYVNFGKYKSLRKIASRIYNWVVKPPYLNFERNREVSIPLFELNSPNTLTITFNPPLRGQIIKLEITFNDETVTLNVSATPLVYSPSQNQKI